MLQAMTETGEYITLALLSREEALCYQKRKVSFYCPVCKSKLIIKVGSEIIPHFAHKSLISCPNQSNGEGAYHERGKLALFAWLKKLDYDVQMEYYLPSIKQQADLFIPLTSKKIAIEYQCATIQMKEILSRTKGYQSIGIIPIWILGGNRMKRLGKQGLYLTQTEQKFLHQFRMDHHPKIIFYCPDTNQFARYDMTCISGQSRTVGQLQFRHLKKTTLAHLIQPLNLNTYPTQWLLEKKRFRLYLPKRLSGQERQFREWLYLNQLTPSLLSSWVGLPVPGQWTMKVSVWTWQTYLCYDFFNRHRHFTMKQFQSYMQPFRKNVTSQFPMLQKGIDPALTYLKYFVLLGKIGFKEDEFSPKGKVLQYQAIEEALENDQKMLKILKRRLQNIT